MFEGADRGPTVLLRADMDALAIDETGSSDHASHTPGHAHKCGHDGHMSMLIGVARRFEADPPARSRLVALFQPSEETGAGARAVIDDPGFAPLRPDVAVAVHNIPGIPTRSGGFTGWSVRPVPRAA